MERVAGWVVTRGMGVLLLGVVVVAVLAPRNTWFVYDQRVVVPVLVLTVAAAIALRGRAGGLARRAAAHPGWTVLAGTVLCLVVSTVVTAGTLMRFGWDARAVAGAAAVLAEGGALDDHQLDYFARFPNNVPLLAFHTVLGQVGVAVGLPPLVLVIAAQVVAAAVITASMGWAALTLGHPARVVPVQALCLLLVGISPHLAAPYSDVLAAACVSVAVLALARAHVGTGRGRLGWLACAVVVLGLGTTIKPFVAVVLIAGCLTVLTQAMAHRSWCRTRSAAAVLGAVAVLGAGVVAGTGALAGQVTGLAEQRLASMRSPFPVALWVASGTFDTQDDSPVRRYGAYNQDLVDLAGAIKDPAQQRVVLLDRARQQVGERGVLGNVSFFSRKIAWVWGDGTFWAHGEGTDNRQPGYLAGTPWGWVGAWNTAVGEHYPLRAGAVQGIWLALLTWVAGSLLRCRWDPLLATLALALTGLTAYLLVFEARPRYVLALLPVLLGLALLPPGRPVEDSTDR